MGGTLALFAGALSVRKRKRDAEPRPLQTPPPRGSTEHDHKAIQCTDDGNRILD